MARTPALHRLRRFVSRISIRLLAFNVLLVFLPASGILALRTYEDQLLERQERSMVEQGRILAAALGGQGSLEPTDAERVIVNLRQQHESRLRIVDHEARILADSSRVGPRRDTSEDDTERLTEPEARKHGIYRLGLLVHRVVTGAILPPEPPGARELATYSRDGRLFGSEVERALGGRYGSTVRRSPNSRSLTLYSALPVLDGERVVGAVVVSRSTFRLLQALYDLRIRIFGVILTSVAVAAVLSLLVSTTIARPLRRLKREASALVDRRGRLRRPLEAIDRSDEIGDLSRALAELTRRLERHLRFTESFASDVSHELKNPLASIRTATELLAEIDDPSDRRRFTGMVLADVARLEGLLSRVREITQIDAELEDQSVETVDLTKHLRAQLEHRSLRVKRGLRFTLQPPQDGPPVTTLASPSRLAQVFDNLLDNAASFSPDGGEVTVSVDRRGDHAVVSVTDQGPGIPIGNLDRVFERFFSDRPSQGKRDHAGLGLAIVKAIVEGYGGTVEVTNLAPAGTDSTARGTRITILLPACT